MPCDFAALRGRSAMRALMLTAILIGGVSSAAADEVRYRLERAGEAFVRMDTQTGAMSLCELAGTELRCAPAAEQGAEGGPKLEARLAALEARIAALEGREPAGAALPTDEEFERT